MLGSCRVMLCLDYFRMQILWKHTPQLHLKTFPTCFKELLISTEGKWPALHRDRIYIYIYIYIYTTTRFGPTTKKKMVGVYHFLVYMQTAPKYKIFSYTTTGALCAPVVVYIQTAIFGAVCIYTKKWYKPTIFVFFLSSNAAVVYIYIYT